MAFSSLSSSQRIAVLLELLGGPEYAARMKGASAATTTFGRSVQAAGRRTFIANQALYTLRRYSFFATIAVTALGAAVFKLGYTYLNSMQQARVALQPVIKDTKLLENYLSQLFQISKYSPFVISDLTKAFSALDLSLGPIGISGQTVINTLASIVDYLSVLQQTTPLAMKRVTNALADLAYQGYLTGRMYQRLAQIGIPIQPILRTQLGVSPDQIQNIASLRIPASDVLEAINRYAKTTPGISGAARRISMRSLGGLAQVLKDTVSQIAGNLMTGVVGNQRTGVQGSLYKLLKPGGPLDKLSKQKGPGATLNYLSTQITGSTGLAKGFRLLLELVTNLGRVFMQVLVPAFVIGLHAMIVFFPVLWPLSKLLGIMADNAWWLKYVFALLATQFIVTHSAMLGMWVGQKLLSMATFGAIAPTKGYIKQLVKLVKAWKAWALAQRAVLIGRAGLDGVYTTVYKNNGMMAKFSRTMFTKVVPALKATFVWANRLKFAFLGWATYILTVVYALRKLDERVNKSRERTQFRGGKLNPVYWLARPGQWILGQKPPSKDQSMATTAAGISSPVYSGGQVTTGPHGGAGLIPNITVHSQLVVDRRILAEAVARANQDKRARR